MGGVTCHGLLGRGDLSRGQPMHHMYRGCQECLPGRGDLSRGQPMHHMYRGCQECLLGRGDLSRARPTSVMLRASPRWAASMASSANAPVPRISTSCKPAHACHLSQTRGRTGFCKTGGWIRIKWHKHCGLYAEGACSAGHLVLQARRIAEHALGARALGGVHYLARVVLHARHRPRFWCHLAACAAEKRCWEFY